MTPQEQRAAGTLPRVLIVAYYFPPISTSGAMRPLGFARYLKEFGWTAHVLTTDPGSVNPPLAEDETLCRLIPTDVRVDRVGHASILKLLLDGRARLRRAVSWGRPENCGSSRPSCDATLPVEIKLGRLTKLKEAVLESLFEFPDPQWSWHRRATRQMYRIEPPDLVLATGGPWTSLVVGQSLARRFGVPLITDFRDPWTRNPFKRSKSLWSERRTQSLERAVCASSSRIIVNTPELGEQFVRDYPEFRHKFVTITNGFDSSDGALKRRLVDESEHATGLELCHFGSVYHRRDPIQLLLAIQHLADQNKISSDQVRVRFVGSWQIEDVSSNRVAEALERRGFVRRESPIPHDACLYEMRRSRALLILQPGSPLQIPAKIYEYVATGRPIVVIGGEGATAALVKRHNLGLCCPNERRQLVDLLERVVSGGVGLDPPGLQDTACFHYRQLTGRLCRVFDAEYRHEQTDEGIPLSGAITREHRRSTRPVEP